MTTKNSDCTLATASWTRRRRDDGRSFERNGFRFDNRHVVPYNPWLLRKYRCHINVEVVNSIRSIKSSYCTSLHQLSHFRCMTLSQVSFF